MKLGRPSKKRKSVCRTISLYPDEWDLWDKARGDLSRGEWVRKQLRKCVGAGYDG